jgi:hypothetical protein
LPVAPLPSSVASARCTSLRCISRYIYAPFDTMRSGH